MSPKMQSAMRIVGHPTNPEADFLMSEDDLTEIAELLIRSSKREDVRA